MNVITTIRKSRKRDFVHALSCFFAKESGADLSNFDVVVSSSHGFQKEHGACAACRFNIDDEIIEVVIDSTLNGKQIILALAHEFIHVRQLALGELIYIGDVPYWNGRKSSRYDYADRPWEIEAYDKMVDLIRKLPAVA